MSWLRDSRSERSGVVMARVKLERGVRTLFLLRRGADLIWINAGSCVISLQYRACKLTRHLQIALRVGDEIFLRRKLGARAAHDGDRRVPVRAYGELGEAELVGRGRGIVDLDAHAVQAQRAEREREVALGIPEHVAYLPDVAVERGEARFRLDEVSDRLLQLALDRLDLLGDC